MCTKEFLETHYNISLKELGSNDSPTINILEYDIKDSLNLVLSKSEKSKGVFTVLLTSLIYKIQNPAQDIRYHQANMQNGYSGRSFDTQYITPFLKNMKFPAMAESGWLTRSLEQNNPYDYTYSGSISPKELKQAFLFAIECVQNQSVEENTSCLDYIFQFLILQRNRFQIDLSKPTVLSITDIINILNKHFFENYASDGAARLPSLAFYAIYECLLNELKRFENKKLLPIESHTSADSRSGRVGDIDITDEEERTFEAVEIKHGIPITVQMVKDSYEKFKSTPIKRFYILSTANIIQTEKDDINNEISKIKRQHGCQVIVNGILDTLKYYLRLLSDSYEFIDKYVKLLETDTAIKFEHKKMWNDIISGGNY